MELKVPMTDFAKRTYVDIQHKTTCPKCKTEVVVSTDMITYLEVGGKETMYGECECGEEVEVAYEIKSVDITIEIE
jgi:transcription elongation factor Elf1